MLCPCCVHVESAEVQLSSNKKKTVHMESMWSPCGVVESTRTLWGREKYTQNRFSILPVDNIPEIEEPFDTPEDVQTTKIKSENAPTPRILRPRWEKKRLPAH